MAFQFEKLLVYQKTVDFADQVCATSEEFTRGYGFLVDQLNHAALSISANIAEGNGRFTKADRKNFFIIARFGAMCTASRPRPTSQLIDEQKHAEVKSQLEEISKMLSGLISGLEKRHGLHSKFRSDAPYRFVDCHRR
jgi:four helix bundle protein